MVAASPDYAEVAASVGSAAAREYARLWEMDAIPADLWRQMGAKGLLGLSTPSAFGGAGLGVNAIARIGRAFVRACGCQGLVTAWQAHNLMADWIFGHFANAAQRAEWLPRIARGEASAAFAVSEPGAGAHPKRLAATATWSAERNGFFLNGQKAYVTNGPIASVFAIVAIVDADAKGRKRFGAFLTPVGSEGLSVTTSEHVDFLKPSGHASLAMKDVFVPALARLSEAEDVYPVMVKPLRDHEDAAGAWTRLGAYERLAAALAATPEMAGRAGGVAARLRAVALTLETDATPEGLLAARAILDDVAREVALGVSEAAAVGPAVFGEAETALARDLAKLGGVARYAVEARFAALGRSLANCA